MKTSLKYQCRLFCRQKQSLPGNLIVVVALMFCLWEAFGPNTFTVNAAGSTSTTQTNELHVNELCVEDIFGRALNTQGITLIDWDGYLANPAIKLILKPPANAVFPVTAILTAPQQRLYFDLPSTVSGSGPRKEIFLPDASAAAPFHLSIFPDRNGINERIPLMIRLREGNGAQRTLMININVTDQDRNLPNLFKITVNFGEDQTGLYNDPAKRNIAQQVARDWSYFIDDMQLDTVAAGDETTLIWDPTGFITWYTRTNASAYRGFLLYTYGIHSSELRSGGEPSPFGRAQTTSGVPLQIRRSGGVEMETHGNFNTLGWYLTTGDNDWWVTGNLGHEQNDFYSIAHHELGHALIFHPTYPLFAQAKMQGFLASPEILAYHGSYPAINASDHLFTDPFGAEVDKASLRGAFGSEYFGSVPARRWLITKLDLLCAQAIGYQLRPTSAFVSTSITTTSLPGGMIGTPYSQMLQATSALPIFQWTVDAGTISS